MKRSYLCSRLFDEADLGFFQRWEDEVLKLSPSYETVEVPLYTSGHPIHFSVRLKPCPTCYELGGKEGEADLKAGFT